MTTGQIVDEIRYIVTKAEQQFMDNEYKNWLESEDPLTIARAETMKGVSFLWGHQIEIVQTLADWSKHDTMKYEKFPCFMLFTDIPIVPNEYGDFDGATLQLTIAMSTQPNYTSPERETQNFRPILRPLLKYFFEGMENSRFQKTPDASKFKCTIWERYYWGRRGTIGNVSNQFNDFLDAIQIENLKVKIPENRC